MVAKHRDLVWKHSSSEREAPYGFLGVWVKLYGDGGGPVKCWLAIQERWRQDETHTEDARCSRPHKRNTVSRLVLWQIPLRSPAGGARQDTDSDPALGHAVGLGLGFMRRLCGECDVECVSDLLVVFAQAVLHALHQHEAKAKQEEPQTQEIQPPRYLHTPAFTTSLARVNNNRFTWSVFQVTSSAGGASKQLAWC